MRAAKVLNVRDPIFVRVDERVRTGFAQRRVVGAGRLAMNLAPHVQESMARLPMQFLPRAPRVDALVCDI